MADFLKKPEIRKIDCKSLDSAMNQMIKNDLAMLPNTGISPKIWRCNWFNTPKEQAKERGLYYKTGDAVWLNTDDPEEFVEMNYTYIKNMVMGNSKLRTLYDEVKDNSFETKQLFINVVKGKEEKYLNENKMPLIYLGDLEKKVQIKISLVDDNDRIPSDGNSKYWIDFFHNVDNKLFEDVVMKEVETLCDTYLKKHLEEYHLDGIQEYKDDGTGTKWNLDDEYLKTDMSNLTGEQTFNSDKGTSVDGFDYVVAFYLKKGVQGRNRWFRVWNSGKVEHGGIIDMSTPENGDRFITDGMSSEDVYYHVNLAWEYEGGVAPKYQYQTSAIGFHQEIDNVDVGTGQSHSTFDRSKQLGESDRYVVKLTPYESNPYSAIIGKNTDTVRFTTNDVDCMTNSSFCIPLEYNENGTKRLKKYSYYVTGYVKNAEKMYK